MESEHDVRYVTSLRNSPPPPPALCATSTGCSLCESSVCQLSIRGIKGIWHRVLQQLAAHSLGKKHTVRGDPAQFAWAHQEKKPQCTPRLCMFLLWRKEIPKKKQQQKNPDVFQKYILLWPFVKHKVHVNHWILIFWNLSRVETIQNSVHKVFVSAAKSRNAFFLMHPDVDVFNGCCFVNFIL